MVQHECTEREAPGDLLRDARTGDPELEEFDAATRERLARLRRAVERGERADSYPVDPHRAFARWLVDNGRLSEN